MLDLINVDLFLVIVLTSIIQSLFGVGVLLFGTPLLLLLDYSFADSLLILLPISAFINLLQITKDYQYINMQIYKNILLFSVPFIMLFLILVFKIQYNISMIVGIILIFIALKDYVNIFDKILNKLMKYEKSYYIIMGIVHGISNLGGALLTARIFHTKLDKYEKRATIAISYFTFALFQMGTLFFLKNQYDVTNIIYIIIGVSIYIFINKSFFHIISNNQYNKYFSIFLLLSAFLLIGK